MLRVETTYAKPGMHLAMPVKHPQHRDQVLLKLNYALTDGAIRRMMDLGVYSLWVRYPSLEFLEKYVSKEMITAQEEVVESITDAFTQQQNQASAKMDYKAYCAQITKLIESMTANPMACVYVGDLVGLGGEGNELMRNSFSVTYLSLLMGLKLENYIVSQRKHCDPARAKDLSNLGLGAMLHDIGLTQLSEASFEMGQLHPDAEDTEYRNHPRLGYELVQGQVDPTAATIVFHHHQRYDGMGFAGENAPTLAGSRIHIFSRIVALADAFDRYQNPIGRMPRPTVEVLAYLLSDGIRERFDPIVLKALTEVVPPYAPGSVVKLNTGQWALVVDHNADMPCRPRINLLEVSPDNFGADDLQPGEEIDLAVQGDDLFITEAQGSNVSEFNFVNTGLSEIDLMLV